MKTLIAKLVLGAAILAPASLFAQYTEGIITFPFQVNPPIPGGIDSLDEITGIYADSIATHGFLLSRGVMTQIDEPGVLGTWPLGINTKRGIVGYVTTPHGNQGLYDGRRVFRNTFTPSGMQITGINDSGTFVGNAGVSGYITVKGVPTAVFPPACAAQTRPVVQINGINAAGDFVGYCFDLVGPGTIGFARIGGVDKQIDYFGMSTFPTGINDSGVIAGYLDGGAGQTRGFTYASGTFTLFDYANNSNPNYINTMVNGINNKGSLVGMVYDLSQSKSVGFYHIVN